MVKLKSTNKVIKASEMRDGQIGVIHEHSCPDYFGRIVQRYRDTLIVIGESSGYSFPSLLGSSAAAEGVKIRLLEAGDTIEIVKN
jgi:hypothetical protein